MIYYVDVDDTLVCTSGGKTFPIPATVAWIKALNYKEHQVFLWSRGGAEYAKNTAVRLGIDQLMSGFLPKPDIMVDDQNISEWTHMKTLHPNELR